ncbi:MAG: enoyl-[acyl-carrier-protein] reductase FabI [Legionellales bacterium]|nr:enoyl-[acyl-carrier-protein] reductase FabI [Legionellales bacterium]|tara:strand:- start:1024 stop:1824 length:801 start_codon:yes stop_codon:yes gene_type:complete
MGFLTGKRALITGVVSSRSIANGIAAAMRREGAECAFTYFGDKMEERVRGIAQEHDSDIVIPCDVQSDDDVASLFNKLESHWPEGFDILVHSIAYAPADQLAGDFMDVVSREGFQIAHDVSAYSFAALGKGAMPYMEKRGGGAMITLSYLGAERAMPSYNVMGIAKASLEATTRYMALSLGPKNIRVNAISAGPVKTLAAMGIKGFKKILNFNEKVSPIQRNITAEDVGNTAAFLCSQLSSGITGEVVHVDGGYHMVNNMYTVVED